MQKAADTQAVYERGRLTGSPMLAPIHPARLTLLIQGLPESLKTFVANFLNGIREVHVQNITAPK